MKYTFDLAATPHDLAEMEEICNYYNIDFSEFLNILIYRSLRCGELPFYPTYESEHIKETISSLNDTSTHKVFKNAKEMMNYIESTEEINL